MLCFVPSIVLAMADMPITSSSVNYVESIRTSSCQDIITLKNTDPNVQFSIIFFVPKDVRGVPIIGYSSCSCDKVKGLTQDKMHQESMNLLFKTVLDKLARKGFKTVRFTARLRERPECLAPFINDLKILHILEEKGLEILIATEFL